MDRTSIGDSVWQSRRADITHVIESGQLLQRSRVSLAGVVADVAWTTDVAECRRRLGAYGRSWYRWFVKDYWAGRAALQGILKDEMPRSIDDQLQLLDTLMAGQDCALEHSHQGRR